MKRGTVLVIREFGSFSETLITNGFEVINFPTIKSSKIEDLSEFEKNIKDIEKYDGIFFTSPNSAAIFLEKFNKKYCGKIYVLGNRIKGLFETKGFEIVYKETANTAEEFIKSFDKDEFTGKHFLFLKGNKSLRIIPQMLEDIAEVDEIIVYQTELFEAGETFVDKLKDKFSRNEIAFICFFSPSGFENFLAIITDFNQAQIKIAAIGKTTAQKISEAGFNIHFTSSNAKSFAFEFCKFF